MLRVNGIQIDPESGAVVRHGEPVRLTQRAPPDAELAVNAGRPVTSGSADQRMGTQYRRELQYPVRVSRLRRRWRPSRQPFPIKTVQGTATFWTQAASSRPAADCPQ
jgi:hypothetical protein